MNKAFGYVGRTVEAGTRPLSQNEALIDRMGQNEEIIANFLNEKDFQNVVSWFQYRRGTGHLGSCKALLLLNAVSKSY
jgi:hypothetical protein